MRIKRYFGKTIRQTIQKVREEQGPDAVILSNRTVDGGVEIVAAIDFDEVLLEADGQAGYYQANRSAPRPQSTTRTGNVARAPVTPRHGKPAAAASVPRAKIHQRPAAPARVAAARPAAKPAVSPKPEPALLEMRRELTNLRGLLEQQVSSLVWGDVARRNPLQANLLRLLLQLELSPKLCQQIAGELNKAQDAKGAWRNALGVLAHKLPVTDDDILRQGGVVALVGPTGVGKTTTVAKLAARFAVRHGSRQVALITTDTYRVGAQEQLRAYAKLLDVPLRIAADANDLRAMLKDLGDRRLVLIDTTGMSQRDLRLSEQFSLIRDNAASIKPYLVLSATTRESGLDEVIRTYKTLHPEGCILTKIDEAASLGGILSLIIKHKLPVAYVSDGQCVPEDLYTARAHSLVSRSVAMMRRATPVNTQLPLAVAMGGALAHA